MALKLVYTLPLLLALLLTPISTTAASSSSSSTASSNNATTVDSIKALIDEAGDSFTNFIYSFSDAFLVAVGSSDQPEKIDVNELVDKMVVGYPPVMIDFDELVRCATEQWRELLQWKLGFVICVAVGVVFVLLMPFVGFFFCCCRCCGNCGGGRRSGKKHSPTKKICCHFILFALAIVLTLFVMGSFIVAWRLNGNLKNAVTAPKETNVIRKTVSTIPAAALGVADDIVDVVEKTLDDVADNAVDLFNQDGKDLSKKIDGLVEEAHLPNFLDQATNLLKEFFGAGSDVGVILDQSAKLNNTALQSVVGNLIETLENCDAAIKTDCDDLKKRVEKLDAGETTAKIPTETLEKVVDVIEGFRERNLTEKVDGIRDRLSVAKEIDEYKKKIVKMTDDMKGDVVKDIRREWNVSIMNPVITIQQQIEKGMDGIEESRDGWNRGIDQGTYALYGISAAAGLAVLCLLTAFLAGCCGPKTSADCFMAFTGFYLIFCPLLMLLTLVFYNSFGQLQVEGCNRLLHPDHADTTLIDIVARKMGNISFEVSDVLFQCSKGEPLYKIVKSTGAFDDLLMVSSDEMIQGINGTIADVRENLDKTVNSLDIDGVTRPILDALDESKFGDVFANISSMINVTEIKTELSAVNLTSLAEKLRDEAERFELAGKTQTASDLKKAAADFVTLDNDGSLEKEVFPVLDAIGGAVERLLNKTTLESVTRSLIADLTAPIPTLKSNLTSLFSDTIAQFSNSVFNLIRTSVKKFEESLSVNVLPCDPVWNVITTVVNVPCSLLVDPVNGYWFEIGGFVGVGVVAVIFAVKIAGILREEIQMEEDEDQVFDVGNNHVTDHHSAPKIKNQVGHRSPARGRGGGRGGRGDSRNDENIAIEMRERDPRPPPYGDDEGTYRSTDNIYDNYRNNKPYSYHDGHVNNGYRY